METSECGLFLDNTEYSCHGQYAPSQPVYSDVSDYPMDSHFPPQTPLVSSSIIVPHFNFPAESELPKATYDGIFHLRSQFDEESWVPHPNVQDPLPMTELTYDLPSEIPVLLSLKIVDKTTDISEMLNPFNSTSNTYPIDSDSVSIKVLKPGGTPSPLKSPKKRKRADLDAMTATLCRSACSQPTRKQESPKKEVAPMKKPNAKKKPR